MIHSKPINLPELNRRFYIDSDWKLRYKILPSGVRGKSIGAEAGNINEGYRVVGIDNTTYFVHRIIYAMYHNICIFLELDHHDKDKLNNDPINNLREVTHIKNQRNRSKSINNRSGITGVRWFPRTKKWQVGIKVNTKPIHLGYFVDKWDAICSRKAAEYRYEFTND